jgi:hypothetical protein
MYLAQTNLEVNTTEVYLYDGQEVYLTVPVIGSRGKLVTQMLTVKGYNEIGRSATIYLVDTYHSKKLIKK